MQLHMIRRAHARKRKKIVGRGGKRGKTSGKGTKGQKARAGHRMRPEIRDIIKKIPKKRGYRFPSLEDSHAVQIVNVKSLEQIFHNGEEVTPAHLAQKGLISPASGKLPPVKILGDGTLSKKISVRGCRVSASARKKIEAAGGTIAGA